MTIDRCSPQEQLPPAEIAPELEPFGNNGALVNALYKLPAILLDTAPVDPTAVTVDAAPAQMTVGTVATQ